MEPARINIKQKLRAAPLLIPLLILVELLWSERVWMMLVVVLCGIWLFEFLWARALARGLRFKRELRYGLAQVGDQLEERFTLFNRAPIPALWVQVTDHSNLVGYDANIATGVGPNAENVWRNKYVCARRGAFHLGPTTLTTGTPFGMYALEFEYAAADSLIVMPPVVPLPEITIAPGGRAYEGRQRASALERTVSADSVRSYLPGDPYKLIHWRTVAHTDEWMVRNLPSTPAGDWWIWLDLDANTQEGSGENSTLEYAIILAASLAERGLNAGRAVGLIVNARELVWLAPQSGEFQRLQIFRALATLEPSTETIAAQLETLQDTVRHNASVILITASLQAEWLNSLLAFQTHATLPTVILLDRVSFGGAASAAPLDQLLTQLNIPHFVFTRELLDSPEARPGHQGEWDWRVSATGRAIARTAPTDQAWRTLQ